MTTYSQETRVDESSGEMLHEVGSSRQHGLPPLQRQSCSAKIQQANTWIEGAGHLGANLGGERMHMRKRFDLVIFDLDGTLIDNRAAIRDNFNYALTEYGFPHLEDERIDAMIGTPLVEMFEKTLPAPSRHLAQKLVEAYVERYKDISHIGTIVLDHVIPILRELRRNEFKLGLATTKTNDTVHPLLQRIGLHKYFDLVTGRAEEMKNKPHPDMLNYVMRELDVKPERAVMVGDTPIDVFTAKNAGIYAVAVTSSIHLGMTTLAKIREAKPDLIISSLRELPRNLYVQ